MADKRHRQLADWTGNDADAKSALISAVKATGLEAVDAGPLARARELEAIGFLQILLMAAGKFPIPVVSLSYADAQVAAALVTFADLEVEAAECPCATPALSAHRIGADR